MDEYIAEDEDLDDILEIEDLATGEDLLQKYQMQDSRQCT